MKRTSSLVSFKKRADGWCESAENLYESTLEPAGKPARRLRYRQRAEHFYANLGGTADNLRPITGCKGFFMRFFYFYQESFKIYYYTGGIIC